MEQIRSFIAIELPDELKLALARIQDKLKQHQPPWVKWVDPQRIHLTLKFLGSIGVDKISPISGAMEAAVRGISPFHLQVTNPGAFPNLKRVQVVWVGIGGETDRLKELQQRLETHLVPLGFSAEKREFSAHLTLARLRNQAASDERQRLGQLIAATRFETACAIKVDTINLMKSQLTREGAIYSKISSVGLNKPLSTAAI